MNWVEFYDSIDLHIRWSDKQDLVLIVNPRDSVYSIKEKIQQSTGPSQRKYIRLIHNGKILNDTQTLKSYGIGKKTSEQPSPFYINCSLSDYIPPKETKIISPAELDRLRKSGFSEQDIQQLQLQLQQIEIKKVQANNRQRQADELAEGTYREMTLGFILGLFLGIICLFWFRKSVFSKRKQWGILLGMIFNISFGIFHVYAM